MSFSGNGIETRLYLFQRLLGYGSPFKKTDYTGGYVRNIPSHRSKVRTGRSGLH